jgi:hypothetical protein
MNTKTRFRLEKNGFIASIFLGGLCLMAWSRSMLVEFTSFKIPMIGIDVATIIGIVLIYTGIRYLQHRV